MVLMKASESYETWWRPLPLWLQGVAILVAFPAWLFIVFCILAGDAKGTAALVASGAFAATALLHIAFDDRNRRGGQERLDAADLSDNAE